MNTETLTTTFFFALILISIALLLMAIGWFIGGTSKILKSCCGKNPNSEKSCKTRDSSCCMDEEKNKTVPPK